MNLRTLLLAILVAMVASSFLGLAKSDAASYGNATCAGTPVSNRTCQHNYVDQFATKYFYLEAFTTDCALCTGPTYGPAFANAKANWGNVPGPQYVVGPNQAPAGYPKTYVYMKQYTPHQDPEGLISSRWGVARNVRTGGSACLSTFEPCNVHYSDVYINFVYMFNGSPGQRQGNYAHEFGHVLGLAHHSDTSALMHGTVDGVPSGPVALDYGTSGNCPVPANITVRCIYAWTW